MIERPKDLRERPRDPMEYAKWDLLAAWEAWIAKLLKWLDDHVGQRVLIESKDTDEDEAPCTIFQVTKPKGGMSEPTVLTTVPGKETTATATRGVYGITRVSLVKNDR